MANRAERLIRAGGIPMRTIAGLGLGLVPMALLIWHFTAPFDPDRERVAEQSMIVASRPFSATISLVGTIQPGDDVSVFAPFDGTVRAIGFGYGDRITAGQMLVLLDTTEINDRRDAAEGDLLKSQQVMAELAGWSTAPDMLRARRARTAAVMDLDNTDRRIAETRALLDKGLVPRAEYDGMVQQRQNQSLTRAAAEDDFEATVRRGKGVNVRLAALELKRNRRRLIDLDAQLDGASIRAQSDGTVARPARDASQTPDEIHVGMHLARGQLIGLIARTGTLSVAFKLDEGDVNQIKVGQIVKVTGPGFGGVTLVGAVSKVGGEAASGPMSSATKASFIAIAKLGAIPPDQSATIRIGMTATIAVETYRVSAAIVVPPAAVIGAAPATTVVVVKARNRTMRAVRIGRVALDGVEILSGLKPGDKIVWTEHPSELGS